MKTKTCIQNQILKKFYIDVEHPNGSGKRTLMLIRNPYRSWRPNVALLSWEEGKMVWLENFLDNLGIVKEW